MKSLLLLGVSALFMAAAAKPFVDRTETDTSSWVAYRSYPYAVWADQAAHKDDWQQAAVYYAMALERYPGEERYARGTLHALRRLQDMLKKPIPDLPPAKLPTTTAKALHIVRYEIPETVQDRLQQTAWRGPIVAFRTTLNREDAPDDIPASPAVGPETAALAQAFLATDTASVATLAIDPTNASALPLSYTDVITAKKDRRWSFNSSSTYRSRALPELPRGAGEFGGSQSGAEMRWRLNGDRQRPLQIAASTFVGNTEKGGFRQDSTQAVIGLRYKPFQAANIVIGADQLLKVGKQSRTALALRAMGDVGKNYDGPPDKNQWLHWHAGFDTALIGAKSRDIFASAEARAGFGFRVNDTTSLTPYVGINALHQQAGSAQTLVETGPGIWLRMRFSDTSRVDMRLAYRVNVAGNARTRDGVVAQVALGF
jgi:hypothetical protein